jgi:RNA ligase
MSYKFPIINHIQPVLDAIEGREEFVVKHDVEAGYKVVNYLVSMTDTFPPVTDERSAILRECRGITFCDTTGVVLARKYHKYFNLGERAETQPDVLNFLEPHDILEKLDGSMLTPLRVHGGIRWCTKMGLTGIALPVDEFVAARPYYNDLVEEVFTANQTPIFEWCSRQQRIVIDHPVDRLVMTAVRDNVTGEYMDYLDMLVLGSRHGVEVVHALPGTVDNLQKFMDHTRDLMDAEGYVVRFKSGHMIKVKAAHYCQIHKTLDHLRHEKDVVRLILDEKVDDAKPFLPEDLVKAADAFSNQIFTTISREASDMFWEVQTAHDKFNGGKKRFADMIKDHPRGDLVGFTGSMFKIWDFIDQGEVFAREQLLKLAMANVGTQNKVNQIRWLLGPQTWRDLGKVSDED